MMNKLKWILTRPRALFRAWKALGLQTMLQLVRIRLTGTERQKYALRIPGFAHPVYIRGGQSSDAIALYEVLVTKEYALTAQLDSPAFIIDGGANCGMASLYFLNRYPKAKVVAVEPAPANLELCQLNLTPYGDRVTLIQGAIWKTAGRLALELGEHEWNNRVRDDQSQAGTVEAFTIPSLISRGSGKVDLLKLDIEGSEGEIFASDTQEWLPKVRNIAIELHGDDCKDRFLAALKGYQYDLSLHCNWTDPTAGSSMSCYVATCQNLRYNAN
jgi:FkbM family methyltransferase